MKKIFSMGSIMLLVSMLIFCASVAAATTSPKVIVTPKSITAGSAVTFSVSGFVKNSVTTIMIGPPKSEAMPVGTRKTDINGSFVTKLNINKAARPGFYRVVICQNKCKIKAVAAFKVTKPSSVVTPTKPVTKTVTTGNSGSI